jgi:hypothetical protein
MTTHPKLKEFEKLIGKRPKPKSTENIFLRWSDAARAMGVPVNTMLKWNKFLPPLPITRQYLEQWMHERNKPSLSVLSRIIYYRIVAKLPDAAIASIFGFKYRTRVRLYWKRALKKYSLARPVGAPATKEEAIQLWNDMRREALLKQAKLMTERRKAKREARQKSATP